MRCTRPPSYTSSGGRYKSCTSAPFSTLSKHTSLHHPRSTVTSILAGSTLFTSISEKVSSYSAHLPSRSLACFILRQCAAHLDFLIQVCAGCTITGTRQPLDRKCHVCCSSVMRSNPSTLHYVGVLRLAAIQRKLRLTLSPTLERSDLRPEGRLLLSSPPCHCANHCCSPKRTVEERQSNTSVSCPHFHLWQRPCTSKDSLVPTCSAKSLEDLVCLAHKASMMNLLRTRACSVWLVFLDSEPHDSFCSKA